MIILSTSSGTWRCPVRPMAKQDGNLVYYMTKNGGGINYGNVSE